MIQNYRNQNYRKLQPKNNQFRQSSPHNKQNVVIKSKMIELLKRIAEMEIRQERFVLKIKNLQKMNQELKKQNKQQLILLSTHPSQKIRDLIQYLQCQNDRLRKVIDEQKNNKQGNESVNIEEYQNQLNIQRGIWVQKFERMEREIQGLREVRIELQNENKDLKRLEEQHNKRIGDLQRDNEIVESRIKKIQQQLKQQYRQNQNLKNLNKDLDNRFRLLNKQVQQKLIILHQQIQQYQIQKTDQIRIINKLKQQLANTAEFSFSNDYSNIPKQNQKQLLLKNQNIQLKWYISYLQNQLQNKNTQIHQHLIHSNQIPFQSINP